MKNCVLYRSLPLVLCENEFQGGEGGSVNLSPVPLLHGLRSFPSFVVPSALRVNQNITGYYQVFGYLNHFFYFVL